MISVRTRQSRTSMGNAGGRFSRLPLFRLMGALIVALAMACMPVVMSGGVVMAKPGSASMSDMGHCAEHSGSNEQLAAITSCMAACAVIEAMAPQPTIQAVHIRLNLHAEASPYLEGIGQVPASPPPRAC